MLHERFFGAHLIRMDWPFAASATPSGTTKVIADELLPLEFLVERNFNLIQPAHHTNSGNQSGRGTGQPTNWAPVPVTP